MSDLAQQLRSWMLRLDLQVFSSRAAHQHVRRVGNGHTVMAVRVALDELQELELVHILPRKLTGKRGRRSTREWDVL